MEFYEEQLQVLIGRALEEDLGDGDHSTLCCIPAGSRGKAILKLKQEGILAGVSVAEKIFRYREPGCGFSPLKKDGDAIKSGEIAFGIEASVHTLLLCERTVLNCMQRMSGIASLTHLYVSRLKGYHTRILDTRKTTPNFRLLEKEAVRIGGAENHRMGLYDMIMLKDNHIDYCGGLETAIERAFEYVQRVKPGLKIEVETRNLEEVERVLACGKVNRILLDNFTPVMLSRAVKSIGGKMETEASGGITLDNIEEYAKTGVDYISVGALIHQAQSLDMSMKAVLV